MLSSGLWASADRLAGDRAQPEAPAGIERGALEPAVVEGEALGLAILEEQLAVVDAGEPATDQLRQTLEVELGAGEEAGVEDRANWSWHELSVGARWARARQLAHRLADGGDRPSLI